MKIRHKHLLIAAITGVMLFPSAQAMDEQDQSLYKQLDALRSENALLTESLKNAELNRKLNEAQLTAGQSGLNGITWPSSTAQVLMVSGLGKKLTALISLANGGRINVSVNDKIPGLGVVQLISINEVLITAKRQIISLPFATDSTGHEDKVLGGSYPSSLSSAMPPLPPVMLSGGAR